MAIAFVRGVDGGNNGGTGSLTYAIDCTGCDYLAVMVHRNDADDLTAVTYNAVAMTFGGAVETETARYMKLYYLFGPSSGTNNVVISATTNHHIGSSAAAYSGVDSGGLDASAVTNTAPAGSASLTTSITTNTANAWVIMGSYGYDDGNAPVAGSGATRRAYHVVVGSPGSFDSTAVASPGSTSLTWAFDSSATEIMGSILIAVKPAGAVASLIVPPSLTLLGVQ